MMRPRDPAPGKYVVDAVAKALDVLEAFDHVQDMSLLEISRRVGLNKSRTFRLLYTLRERGYVERGLAGTHYKLGLKVLKRSAAPAFQTQEASVRFTPFNRHGSKTSTAISETSAGTGLKRGIATVYSGCDTQA